MNALRLMRDKLPSGKALGGALRPEQITRLLPVVLLAIGITALVMMFLWNDQASYKPVFGAREQVPVSDMMATLDAEGIAYRLHPESGQVLVSSSDLGRARMLLAAKGVTARLPEGLELMDKNDPLGVTQFVQDIRFRRGLEGELVQSITSMDAVRSARVHLSVARSSTFVLNAQDKSTASVVLNLHPGRTLGNEQIASIIQLVAGSVSNLDPARVSVVDQAGRLLSARVDVKDGIDQGSFADEAVRKAQSDILQNAHQLLQPLLGAGNYNVSVAVELGQDRVQETQERYGDVPKVTNEASREESNRDRVALGVPGSLSNRPATPAPDAAPNTAERSAVTRQFAYDRSVTTIQRARGQLKKLSVAVVLNDGAAPGATAGWTPEDIARMENLLRGGLGINAERGDQLVVSSLAFPGATPAVPWYAERETVFEFVTWGLYALGALLCYFLLARPLLRILRERQKPPAEVGMTDLIALEGGAAGATAEPPALANPAPAAVALPNKAQPANSGAMVPLLADYDLPPPGSPVEVLVNHLKVLAQKEPERVAEVVKQWVQKNAAIT
ncbi:MAG: flagellar M-ring protein FliF [Hydrogenophaga sp.]|jgi:flagellar M-ring protein FliF|uniref:flagellar basal-body MS-ring/collar protein FliF n=1 Tax=Hydrogenophaga sp. TaxID=1904254 RepID=UPI002622899F|nr:flagellar basal-body MS-ring/collar protein FliF [Hydrogenophaga sp.]MCW5671550.1 flagellar M-ring protein FliF [Hydrogenophaga sp.]